MEARIVHREGLVLAGMGYYGDPFSRAGAWDEENEIGALWKRLMSFLSSTRDGLPEELRNPRSWYEVHLTSSESPVTGRYEVFVGVEVAPSLVPLLPPLLSAKALPGGAYGLVTAQGAEINGDMFGGLEASLRRIGAEPARGFGFELYDGRFKGMDRLEESEVDFYLPLSTQESI